MRKTKSEGAGADSYSADDVAFALGVLAVVVIFGGVAGLVVLMFVVAGA